MTDPRLSDFGFGPEQSKVVTRLLCGYTSVRWIDDAEQLRRTSSPAQAILVARGIVPPRSALSRKLAGDGIVIFAKAENPRLDICKSTFREHGHIGVEDGAAGEVWWGSPSLPHPDPHHAAAPLPLLACYFTVNTPYEEEARRLQESCLAAGVPCIVRGLAARGSWEANCAMKSGFLLDLWRETGRPLLWVDADAIVHQPPDLLRGTACDFAINKIKRWEFASGTAFFNSTPAAGRLLERWTALCRRHPHIWDQILLDAAWEETVRSEPLVTQWLPPAYTLIFDQPEALEPESPPVIVHHQASRRLKTAVAVLEPPRPVPFVSEPWRRARRAGRSWLDRSGHPRVLPQVAAPNYLPFPGMPEIVPPEFGKYEKRVVRWLRTNRARVLRLAVFGNSWFGARLISWARRLEIEPIAVFDNCAVADGRTLLDVSVRQPATGLDAIDCLVVASLGHSREITEQVRLLAPLGAFRVLAAHQHRLGTDPASGRLGT